MAGAEISAAKTVAGDQHHAADAGRQRRRAARFGHALDSERPPVRLRAPFVQARARSAVFAIDQIEIGKRMCELRLASASPAYLSSDATRAIATARCASSFEPSLDMSLVDTTARRFADQHPQAEIVALRTLALLDRAVAYFDRLRQAPHRHRIGSIGTRGDRRANQPFGAIV